MKASPKYIPGIPEKPKPPDPPLKSMMCKNCHRLITFIKKVTDPVSHKVTFVCPFCGREP